MKKSDTFLFKMRYLKNEHRGVKHGRIRSNPGPHFPAFRLKRERYAVSLRVQSECGKIRIRITSNMDTFHAVETYIGKKHYAPIKLLKFLSCLSL